MRVPNRPYLIGSLAGVVVFAIPLHMLIVQRTPVVETINFHMEPSTVRVGQKTEAVWTDKVLRAGCGGIIYRQFISGEELWVFPPTSVVHHDDVGAVQTFHTQWVTPRMPAGRAVFHKNYYRWCNVFQRWLWPMYEEQEAEFTVVE
jgi:hypothetical protein